MRSNRIATISFIFTNTGKQWQSIWIRRNCLFCHQLILTGRIQHWTILWRYKTSSRLANLMSQNKCTLVRLICCHSMYIWMWFMKPSFSLSNCAMPLAVTIWSPSWFGFNVESFYQYRLWFHRLESLPDLTLHCRDCWLKQLVMTKVVATSQVRMISWIIIMDWEHHFLRRVDPNELWSNKALEVWVTNLFLVQELEFWRTVIY